MSAAPESMLRDPCTYAVDEILRDGGSIHIRAIRPDDKGRLPDHFGRLGSQSIYYRFFRVKKPVPIPPQPTFPEPNLPEPKLLASRAPLSSDRVWLAGNSIRH